MLRAESLNIGLTIDPGVQAIAVLQLDRGAYCEVGKYAGDASILSPELTHMGIELSLTVGQMFEAIP